MRLATNPKWHRGLGLLTALTLVTSACADDDPTTTPSDTPTTSAPTATETETEPTAIDWVSLAEDECAGFKDLSQEKIGPVFESEGGPDPEQVRMIFEEMGPVLQGMVDEVSAIELSDSAATDRDELVAAWQVQVDAFAEASASGEAAMAQLESQDGPFTREAGEVADRLGVAGCGTGTTFEQDDFTEAEAAAATQVDVDGTEYSFESSTELTAGDHVFSFQNVGGEEHEMILVGIAEGTSYDEAITFLEENAESDEEPDFMTGFWGGFAGPGGRTDINARLEAGTYMMICFLPAPDEQPHFLKGMHQEVTVS